MSSDATMGETETETTTESADFAPGAFVVDREDQRDDPNLAVVLNTPPVPADEWTVPRLEKTVAEDNPEHPAESPVVVIAFRDHLEEQLPEWGDRDGYWPIKELNEQGVSHYAFPAARLERVDVEEAPDPGLESEPKDEREAELEDGEGSEGSEDDETESEPEPAPEPEPAINVDGLAQRLEDAGCAVARRDRGLRVSKLGETYLIKLSGEIEGDGALRERLDEIVEQFEEADDE